MSIDSSSFGQTSRESRSGSEDLFAARRPPSWRWWLCGSLVAVGVIVASMFSPYFRNQWKESVGREPATYTALSFNGAATLPTSAVRGKAIHIAFTVTNEGSDATSYRYLIATGSGVQLKTSDAASNTVAPGESWVVNKYVLPNCAQATCRVQVSLPQQDEQIDFVFTLKPGNSNRTAGRE